MPRHAPARRIPSRAFLVVAAGATLGMTVPPVVIAAQATAPRVTAAEVAAVPVGEPVGHGGLGGPLAVPSIGAVVSDPPAYLPPVTQRASRETRPAERPQEPRGTVGGSTGARPTVTGAPRATPEAARPIVTPSDTATTTQETTPTATTETTTAPTTTGETTEATVTTETTATTTSEPAETTDVGDLIQQIVEQGTGATP